MTTTPHAANMSGRPINPDTDNLLPSPSAAQQQLVRTLLARLVDELPAEVTPQLVIDLVDPLLTEAVVREHGRTLRSCIAELRAEADEHEGNARTLLTEAVADDGTVLVGRADSAAKLATAAAAVRGVATRLRGDR